MSLNNIYNDFDIRKGAFPRKRRRELVHLAGGVYGFFAHKITPGGHTLSHAEVEKKRLERQIRSTKHRAKPSRAVPATGGVRASSRRLSVDPSRFGMRTGPVWLPRNHG